MRSARPGAQETAAAARADAGLLVAIGLLEGAEPRTLMLKLKLLLGERQFSDVARRLVTNAHRSDVHFLPADEQPPAWSVIREPSVALFRYPLSVPIDVLDLAGTASEAAWPTEIMRMRPLYPCVDALAVARPIKVLRIRPRFLSDLLTRFTGLYGRIGSPDFADGTIDQYVAQIGESA